MSTVIPLKLPGTLAERFWSIARSTNPEGSPTGDDTTSREPKAVARHVLKILDALSAGEVGDGVSQSTVSFLALLRQQEEAGDMSYASPEQARGETLDERSLVFSVGVLMFEELTGRHPFGAVPSARRFARIQKCELGSGVQYFPQVPSQLRNVLMRAMGPFPEERYASLRELRSHLERFLNGRPDETPGGQRIRRLKGLPPSPAEIMFGNVEEQLPTMVHRKLPSPPPVARPLQPSQAVRTVEVPVGSAAPSSRRRKILERLAWAGVGAVGALGISLLLVPSLKAPAARTPAASAPVAEVAAPSLPIPTATPFIPPKSGIEPPAVPPVAAPPLAKFDLLAAGKDGMASARKCFGDLDHSVSFGAGLLFSKEDAVARRVFLSPDEPLSADDRKCVKGALATASAGAPPDKNTVADYRFKLRPGDGSHDEVKFALTK